ncbi:hypothetical protein RIF29_27774 [Crotalaria pallida]|uniref:Uncharacterized protein n=1 Tax=Crotalaria pallida TaxID=3830 RepID=A0AAN9I5X6_CROPI
MRRRRPSLSSGLVRDSHDSPTAMVRLDAASFKVVEVTNDSTRTNGDGEGTLGERDHEVPVRGQCYELHTWRRESIKREDSRFANGGSSDGAWRGGRRGTKER